MSATDEPRPADASPVTWVDRHVPAGFRPYLRLARADRPIGIWLLLWPCLWSISLGALQATRELSLSGFWLTLFVLKLMILFAIGAAVMRGAGCTYNDIVDRDIDAKVARTAGRPIPSGQVSIMMAWAFLGALLLAGLLVLLSLNTYSIYLGAASLIPVAIYPFMKRITNWPQAFLGITFNWGALLGWTAVLGSLALTPIVLFMGCVFWTLGYDTIYAHQDKEDDALIGVHSTARLFGEQTKLWVGGFYALAWVLLLLAGWLAGCGNGFFVGMVAVGAHLGWQVLSLDIHDGANCLRIFKSNRDLGTIMFAAIVLGLVT